MDGCNLILLRTESLYLMPQIFGGNFRFSVCKSIKKTEPLFWEVYVNDVQICLMSAMLLALQYRTSELADQLEEIKQLLTALKATRNILLG